MQNLVSLLSVSEMVDQMAHGGANNNGRNGCKRARVFAGSVAMVSFPGTGPAPAIKRLGINPYQWGTECISGDVWAGNATSFPMSIGLVNQIAAISYGALLPRMILLLYCYMLFKLCVCVCVKHLRVNLETKKNSISQNMS